MGIYMEETLFFMGHPPEPVSLVQEREQMGCASKADGGRLLLATFGEGHCIEGETSMRLLVRVPTGVPVETRQGLSGPKSAGRNQPDGWKPIASVPDPRFTAMPAAAR